MNGIETTTQQEKLSHVERPLVLRLAIDWHTHWNRWGLPLCLTELGNICDTYVADFTGDAQPEILLLPPAGQGVLFTRDDRNQWHIAAYLNAWALCEPTRDALAANRYRLIAPHFMDVEINGTRLHLEPVQEQTQRCK